MSIIISKNGKNAEKVNESNFELENKLQQYIYDNPDTIPLYDIDEDIRLFIAAREFSTQSGPIDALGFDQNGNIYVVETKLYKNPDKRTVVAQALDYGASLWRHSTNFEDFVQKLNSHTEKQFGMSFQDKYTEFFGLEDATDNLQSIRVNLNEGSIKFVVLMDKLHDTLKDLVIFVNQNSKFDLYAVELEYYKHAEFEIIIPKIFGAEVKKDVVTNSSKSKWQWSEATESDFMSRVREASRLNPRVKIEQVAKVVELANKAARDVGGSVQFGHVISKTRDVGKLVLNNSIHRAVFYVDSDASAGFYMFDANSNFDVMNKSIRNQIIDDNLFGKGLANREASQILFNFPISSDLDIENFLDIFEKAIEKEKK